MVIEKGIKKALAIRKEQLRNEKLKNNADILPFVTTYNLINSKAFLKLRNLESQPVNLKRLLCSLNFLTNKPTFRTAKQKKLLLLQLYYRG